MTEVKIRPGAADEITIPNTVGWELTEEVGKMWRMVISVERSYLENETVNRKQDDVELVGEKTGILIDVETGSSVWNLVVYSYEWAANRAGFTAGGDRREGDDQTLINGLISEVPDWTAGTIGTFTGPLTFVFNHAHRHEALRRIERNVPGELRFSNQGTVDYVDRLGIVGQRGTIGGNELDVSDRTQVNFTLQGGAGGNVPNSASGGSGRYAEGSIDVSSINEIVVYTAEKGNDGSPDGDGSGGLGWADGGAGGSDPSGGGGAAAAITLPDGTVLVATPGGGGAGDFNPDTGSISEGGGGAEGGAGATNGEIVADVTNGGDGTTGDGGDAGVAYANSTYTTISAESLKSGDGTATVDVPAELSASAGTIEDEISITERGRELDGTHIRVLGAHEGEAQFFANLVPSTDSGTYDNRVNYTTSRWSDGDPKDWDRWENMDVVGQDTIEEEASALGEELSESLVEAKATVSGVDLNVGDTVQVVKPDANLNRSMRIHRLKEVVEGAKQVYECLLSTRTTMRADDGDDLRDIQRYNTAWQGSSVAINAGPFGKAVDATHPLSFNFKYPNLEYENSAQLHIKGLEYRIDSQGSAAGGDHSHWVDVYHPSHDHTYTYQLANHRHDLEISTTSSKTDTSVAGTDHDHLVVFNTHVTEYTGGQGTAVSETSETALGTTNSQTSDASGTHTHPPDPGIYTTADTPTGVDVSINGTEVATNIGTGTFETVIDVPGEFINDAWNEVTVSSDSLGILEISAFLEGYDQIGTR